MMFSIWDNSTVPLMGKYYKTFKEDPWQLTELLLILAGGIC